MQPDLQRALLLMYGAVQLLLPRVAHELPLYRALCQLRSEIEKSCHLPETPTRRTSLTKDV